MISESADFKSLFLNLPDFCWQSEAESTNMLSFVQFVWVWNCFCVKLGVYSHLLTCFPAQFTEELNLSATLTAVEVSLRSNTNSSVQSWVRHVALFPSSIRS